MFRSARSPSLRALFSILAAACVAVCIVPSVALAQSFELLGLPTGGTAARAYGISDDGRRITGSSSNSGGLGPGWVWTAGQGRNDYGLLPGMPQNTRSRGISGDGTTMVGEAGSGASGGAVQAYRYREGGPLELLGITGSYNSSVAYDASHDGEVVVGNSYTLISGNEVGVAYRWTEAGGMQPLGYTNPGLHSNSRALAASRDGRVIVGISQGVAHSQGFVWRAETGMVALERLPGSTVFGDVAVGVNFDGSLIVGNSGNALLPTVWRNGVPESLGLAPGYRATFPNAISDDGSVIVGRLSSGFAPNPVDTAGIWLPSRGWLPLSAYLTEIGVTIPSNINMVDATGISADGRTITGYTGWPGTTYQGFVVTIPTPAACMPILICLVCNHRRRSR